MSKASREIADKLIELWRESVIVQSILTIMFGTMICAWYLIPLLQGAPMDEITAPPGEILTLTGAIIGYWFKTKDRVANKAEMVELQKALLEQAKK